MRAKKSETVQWNFLILRRLLIQLVNWDLMNILEYTMSIQLSILMNGSPTKHFKMSKGFKQEILYHFSRMFIKAKEAGIVKGVEVHDLNSTHLEFADDIILCCSAKWRWKKT